jgi:hypothetical protein
VLFPSKTIDQVRRKLYAEIGRGAISEQQAYEQLLAADPHDDFALVHLGAHSLANGDALDAEKLFERALLAQPFAWEPYIAMAHLAFSDGRKALGQGFLELGLRRMADNPEATEHLSDLPILEEIENLTEMSGASGEEKIQIAAEAFRLLREEEPSSVSNKLRLYRMLDDMWVNDEVSRDLVDAVLGEGSAIVPILIGVLRAWARATLSDDYAGLVENSLALLGEIGQVSTLSNLLEFIGRDPVDLSGAATWAVGRILAECPEEAGQELTRLAPEMAITSRIAIGQILIHHAHLDPGFRLSEALCRNLSAVQKSEHNDLLPLFFMSLAARGPRGAALARQALRGSSARLSRKVREECLGIIEVLSSASAGPPPPDEHAYTVYEICAGEAVWDDVEDDSEYEADFESDEVDDGAGKYEDEFDALAYSPEPVRKTSTPGRNDPCWCGSGKKYKKCHLNADAGASTLPPPLAGPPLAGHTARGRASALYTRIKDLQGELLTEGTLAEALPQFGFFDPTNQQPERQTVFLDWIVHDWPLPKLGRTTIEEFQRRNAAQLSKQELDWLESWRNSFFGLYEVQDIKKGTGIEVRNLLFPEIFFVHDVSFSKVAVRWDVMLVRVIEGDRGKEFGAAGEKVPRGYLQDLLAWMEEDRRERRLDWGSYMKRNLPRVLKRSSELSQQWLDGLRVSNNDREELLFSKAIFEILDEETLTASLRESAAFREGDDANTFVWVRDTDNTVLGNLHLQHKKMVFECNSRERLELANTTVLATLPHGSVRHLRDEFTTLASLKEQAAKTKDSRKSPARDSGIPKEVEHQIVTEYLERHYASWPDTPIPALDGKTPRQAARTERGRCVLRDLLRDFENGEERKRQNGEPFYDVNRIRRELALD